jgi:arginine/ornithine N-succinyltransferase beta subunit
MLTTTYHQTAIDTTGVEEANRADLLEALAREADTLRQRIEPSLETLAIESQRRAAEVKSVLESFETEDVDWTLVAIVASIGVGLIWLCVHFGAQVDSWRLW